ncbi:hypothetical protein [Bradyrhizobium manausense]|uniref:Uncharacterized protein n=1 Tax=Bradyrhizobium manausense TaxID=989370 RepID=A0A0R3DDD1_9BRAD|nr:hypothetical protein [Bradyrhizobium manausense]KRQ04930.1 hypothetical protein AOQ71_29195 [Bradyrhizobium manausense]
MRWILLIQFALFSTLGSAPTMAQVAPIASLLNVSSFMMPPRSTWATIDSSADANVTVSEHMGEGDVGFRVFHLRAAVKGSKQAAVDLARSKLLRPGDILLSFRPLWDKTLAYAHMQLGVSHSGMAFIVSDANDQFVMTLESPISYSSPLNYPEHYSDLDAIHVIRPALTDGQRRNLEQWAKAILGKRGNFEFFADYGVPMYKRGIVGITVPKDQIRFLAEIALGQKNSSFKSYCSEFVWSLLGLRDCNPGSFDESCIRPIFSTTDGMLTGIIPKIAGDAGLVQGPEAALIGGKYTAERSKAILTQSVFVDFLTDESQLASRMSSGHIKVAKDSRASMKVVNGYYAMGEPAPMAGEINKGVTSNVSPTSFLIRSNAGLDGLQYVGTVIFDR